MANTVNTTLLLTGPRNVVLFIYLESDGTSGELTGEVILDPATLVPPSPGGEDFILVETWSELSGFDALLSYEAVAPGAPMPVWSFTPTGRGHQCFKDFGGIPDLSGLDATGKVLLSTNGFTASGDRGSLVLMFTRKNV
jgi:hypothetical protein